MPLPYGLMLGLVNIQMAVRVAAAANSKKIVPASIVKLSTKNTIASTTATIAMFLFLITVSLRAREDESSR